MPCGKTAIRNNGLPKLAAIKRGCESMTNHGIGTRNGHAVDVAVGAETQWPHLFELESSIDLSGTPSVERLTIDGTTLRVGSASSDPHREWPLGRIADFRLADSVGSSFLQASLDGRWSDVLRFPGRIGPRLSAAVDELKALVGGQDRASDETGLQEHAPANGVAELCDAANSAQLPSKAESRVAALIQPFWRSMAVLFALSVGAVVIDVLPPLLQRVLVDDVLQVDRPATGRQRLMFLLLAIVGGLLLLRVSAALVAVWKGWVSSRVGADLTARLRMQLVEKLSRLPLAFYDRNQVGRLMSQVAYDTETLHTLVYHLTSGFLLQSLQLVGIGVMLFFLNPKLALITLLPMPLIAAGGWYFTRRLHPMNQRYWEAVGKQASALMGMLSGIQVVKAFVQERREMQRFRESSGRLRDSRINVDVSTSTFSAAMALLFAFGTLAVWYVGGRDVLVDKMSLGSLVAFLAYLAMFYTPLTSIAESTSWFASFFSTIDRMSNIVDAASEPAKAGEKTPWEHCRGKVEFRDVTFGYNKARPVLTNIDLAIAPGEMVGIVGRSGSGKSTLVNLITRLYEADAGQILIDGVDVREFDPRELRRHIGMVPQTPFLFRGSVAENITYGNPGASPEQILLAARRADAHDFIMRLPLAYDAQLGEGGTGLSGGERQRLSIARALLCDPAVLILDEATASVDAESERTICEAIRRWAERRTTILIAHRLSTLQDADRLFVFDQGRLAEQGSHDELIERRGIYQSLARLQWNGGGQRSERESNRDDNPLRGWVEPVHAEIADEGDGLLCVTERGSVWPGAFGVLAFPATHHERYISLQQRDASGCERELGMISSLAAWPRSARAAVQRSLGRRYLLRPLAGLRQIRSEGNRAVLLVSIDGVRREVQVDNRDDNVCRFGDNGLLFIDVEGIYYVIADRGDLPKRQRNLLELYFGIE